jgi:hypothetical protein
MHRSPVGPPAPCPTRGALPLPALAAALACTLLFVLAAPTPAQGTAWVVNPEGTGDAETIQAAIDSAAYGDTVLVEPGTYLGVHKLDTGYRYTAAEMKSGVTVRSMAGPDSTIIDVTNTRETDYFYAFTGYDTDSTTTLDGFKLVGCDGYQGGAMIVYHGRMTIRNCIFYHAYAGYGGSIAAEEGSAITVEDCVFDSSYSCCGQAGAMGVSASTATIRNCTFIGSECAFVGGAIVVGVGSNALIEDNQFLGNWASGTGPPTRLQGDLLGQGGAIYLDGAGAVTISGNLFSGNIAQTQGGAIYINNSPDVTITDNVIVDNNAVGRGGAFYIVDSSPVMSGLTITGNTTGVEGGALYITGTSSPNIENSILAYNHGANGIVVDGASAMPTFSCSDVFGNEGSQFSGMDDPTGVDGNLSVPPLFCEGSTDLQSCSPLLDDPTCGRIGASADTCSCDPSVVPNLTLAIHQNPALSSHVDLVVVSDLSTLGLPTVAIMQGETETPVEMEAIGGSDHTYRGPYVFTASGQHTITVDAASLAGVGASISRDIMAASLAPGAPGTVATPDGSARLQVPAGALAVRTTFLAWLEDAAADAVAGRGAVEVASPVFHLGPEGPFAAPLEVRARVDLSRYDNPGKLRLERQTPAGWEALPSRVLTDEGAVTATVSRLGSFRVVHDASFPGDNTVPLAFAVSPGQPNPFHGSTAIAYRMPADGPLRIEVFSPTGRRVATLFDGEQAAGSHVATWDGRGHDGTRVASGVYFCRVEAQGLTRTIKVSLLR